MNEEIYAGMRGLWVPTTSTHGPAFGPAAGLGPQVPIMTPTVKAELGRTPGCPGCVQGQRGKRHSKACEERQARWFQEELLRERPGPVVAKRSNEERRSEAAIPAGGVAPTDREPEDEARRVQASTSSASVAA